MSLTGYLKIFTSKSRHLTSLHIFISEELMRNNESGHVLAKVLRGS